jgi:hypothetical protein
MDSTKKELAKLLFTNNDCSPKEIAARTAVTESTINKWIIEGNWETLKHSLLLTKDLQLRLFYQQLGNLNNAVMQGVGYPTTKEADVQKKLTASIHALETETNIAQVIQVAKDFTTWLPNDDMELVKTILLLFDSYIKQQLKRL